MTNSLKSWALPFLLILTLAFVYAQKVTLDFWNDELYTLVHFALVPVFKTVSDYHVPNNHVLLNLINNIYLKLIGVSELNSILEQPWKLRIIPFIYCVALFSSCYYYCKALFSKTQAILAVLLIAGSIPYFNFAMQIRGYGLSSLLLLLALFNSLIYYHKRAPLNLIGFVIWSVLCCYTILSNVYSVFTICLFWILLYFFKRESISSQNKKMLGMAFFAIPLLVFLLYLPMLNDILSNGYATTSTPFLQWQIEFYLPHLKEAFVSGQIIVVLIFLVSPILVFRSYKRNGIETMLLVLLCILPVFISYARGDEAPLRTFVPLFPISAILMSFGVNACIQKVKNKAQKWILFSLITIYVGFAFNNEVQSIENTIASDIENGGKRQFLYHQYYNSHYQPFKSCEEFSKETEIKEPILIIGCDVHGIPYYLDYFNIPFYKQEKSNQIIDSMREHKSEFYLVTNRPNQIKVNSDDTLIQLSTKKTYHTFMKYLKKEN